MKKRKAKKSRLTKVDTTMIYVGGDSVEYDFTNVINKYNVLDYKK